MSDDRVQVTDDASWKAAVDMALRHAEVATKLVQFFLLASIAVGGWLVSSPDMRDSARFSSDRIAWATLYTLLSVAIWFALMDLQRRINACYRRARSTVPEEASDLVREFNPLLVRFGFPLFVVAIDIIILAL